MNQMKLGRTNLTISRVGLGTAAWGFKLMGYGKKFTKADLWEAYRISLDNGVNFIDTADSYADGDSERLIGEFHERDGRPVVVATKHDPRKDSQPKAIVQAIERSRQRLRIPAIDLYQLHYPPQDEQLAAYADILAGALRAGLIRAIGVSNFNLARTMRFHDELAVRGIPLASNQVYYHLLERRIEKSGLIDYCEKETIAIIPLSPMAQGVLTGKFARSGAKLSGIQKIYFWIQQQDLFHEGLGISRINRLIHIPEPVRLKRYRPLFQLMREIAGDHRATVGQVALLWLIAAGRQIIPIPGAKNGRQAAVNSRLPDESLSEQEFHALCRMEEKLADE